MKIFTGDNIGGSLRPILGHVDIFLTEDSDALFVADQRGALFPFDGIERVLASIGKEALEHQASALAD